MADGSIVFTTELDDAETQKKLTKLTHKIDALNDDISKNKAFKLPLVEQAKELGAALDAAKAKLYEMQQAGVPTEAIKAQRETVNSLQAEWNKVVNQIDAYDRKIKADTQELEWSENHAGEIAQKLAEAGYSAEEIKRGIEKADKSAKKFASRMKKLAASALVFSVITQALRGFRDWIGDVVKATPEASAAVAKLKGALLTMVQPLVNIIIPAFTTLVNVLTAVVAKLAEVFAFLSGTTIESSAQAAEALNAQTEALNGTGSAAKKAGKSLASFDEINQLSNSGGSSSNEIVPDFSFNDEISERLEKIAKIVLIIGAGFAAWKINGAMVSSIAAIAAAVGGLILLWYGLKDAWDNGVDWNNMIAMIAGAAIAAAGLYGAFGSVGASIALVVAGAAMIVTAFDDIIENGANLQNTLLLIAGIVATGLGFFLLTGSTIPLVIAGIASIVVAVLALTGNLEAFVKNLKENILGGLIDFITGVFTGDWEKAWLGVKKVFYGIFSSVVMIFESAINLIIRGLNWVIGKMNSLLSESFISKGLELVGVNFTGIRTIPKVDLVSKIPALAQGAVIPPNREFIAVLGDQKSGNNIEAPEALIRKIVREESGGASTELLQDILEAIRDGHVIVVDRRAIGRTAAQGINDITISTGKSPLLI